MKFTDEQRKDIEEKLLIAGIQEFGFKGIKAVTVDTLVQQAGISKGMFYKFYESKEIFFFKCIEKVEADIKLQIVLPALTADGDIGQNIKNLFIKLGTFIEDYPILVILNDPVQFNYLQARVPAQVLAEHIKEDDNSAAAFIEAINSKGIQLSYSAEFISGLFRLLAMLPLFRKEVGPHFDLTKEFIISAAIDKLLDQKGEHI